MYTGDMGFLELDGYFHLLDLEKDVIIFECSANEIDDVDASHARGCGA